MPCRSSFLLLEARKLFRIKTSWNSSVIEWGNVFGIRSKLVNKSFSRETFISFLTKSNGSLAIRTCIQGLFYQMESNYRNLVKEDKGLSELIVELKQQK